MLRRDEDGYVIGIFPQALELRESETFLSVTWLEHFAADYEQALIEAVEAIRRQLDVKKNDGFAIGVVGKISEICDSLNVKVRVLHEPEPPENTGHSALRGVPRDNLDLLDLLAAQAFVDTRISSEIP